MYKHLGGSKMKIMAICIKPFPFVKNKRNYSPDQEIVVTIVKIKHLKKMFEFFRL